MFSFKFIILLQSTSSTNTCIIQPTLRKLKKDEITTNTFSLICTRKFVFYLTPSIFIKSDHYFSSPSFYFYCNFSFFSIQDLFELSPTYQNSSHDLFKVLLLTKKGMWLLYNASKHLLDSASISLIITLSSKEHFLCTTIIISWARTGFLLFNISILLFQQLVFLCNNIPLMGFLNCTEQEFIHSNFLKF